MEVVEIDNFEGAETPEEAEDDGTKIADAPAEDAASEEKENG